MAQAKIKIATLGAATLDVFLTGDILAAKRDVRSHDYVEQFPLGAKLELDGVTFSTGGGAANAAITFARYGLDTTVLAKVGDDLAGREIIKTLKSEGVATTQMAVDLTGQTGYSTILLTPTGERTILVYRGASEQLTAKNFAWSRLKAGWLYITSLAGNLELLEEVVNKAHQQGIKIALDPGSRELAHPATIKRLAPKLTLLKGNKEEMGQVFEAETATAILRHGALYCRYLIVTDGYRGSYATDGTKIYRAGVYKDVPVIDRTGAGDAFGSGVVAGLANGQGLAMALSFGSANSTSVVRYIGANAGVLKRQSVPPMPIKVEDL